MHQSSHVNGTTLTTVVQGVVGVGMGAVVCVGVCVRGVGVGADQPIPVTPKTIGAVNK